MSDEIRIKQLAELFKKTGQVHHQAFIETDGEDPDGQDRWMPESADIIRYLQASYGRAAA